MAQWAWALAGELGRFGITVNNVFPGYTNTDRLRSLIGTWAESASISYDDMEGRLASTVPMRRIGEPAKLGSVVGFLTLAAASYVTGVNLPVDRGRTAVQTAL